MHRVLLVQELLRYILSYVESPASAFALALTTRSFCDIALERVWSHGTAWDLAMTIPEEFRKIQWDTDRVRTLSLTRTPRPTEWLGPRFHFYARSMRTLWVDSVKPWPLSTDGYNANQNFCRNLVHPTVVRAWVWYGGAPNGRPFPLLRELKIHWSVTTGLDLIVALAGEHLKSFHLHFDGFYGMLNPHTEFGDLLRGVSAACPRVTELSISFKRLRARFALASVAPSLQGWQSLHSITLEGVELTPDVFGVLDALPLLETLCLTASSQLSSVLKYQLPRLRTLELACYFLSDAAVLLRSLGAPSLRSVIFNPTRCQDFGLVEPYISFAAALAQYSTLETIFINGPKHWPPSGSLDPNRDLQDILTPLLTLPHVRRLHLYLIQKWKHADLAVISAAQAWPELEELVLTGPQEMTVSWATFAFLLYKCPSLRMFGIPIDAQTPLPPGVLVSPFGANTAMRTVELTTTVRPLFPSDVEPIAEVLHRLCPEVRCETVWQDEVPLVPQVGEIQMLLASYNVAPAERDAEFSGDARETDNRELS